MADSSAMGAVAVHHSNVYAQRMLPESPALVALFHAQSAPRTDRVNLRRRFRPAASCLRKISAYSGGFRVAEHEEEDSSSADSARDPPLALRSTKKRLSFADQHGGQLVLEREFHARDAPIYCNKAITYSLPAQYGNDRDECNGWQSGPRSIVERLLRGALRGVGRGGGSEQQSGWSQPELLSLCVLSCSVVGCVVIGYARAAQSK